MEASLGPAYLKVLDAVVACPKNQRAIAKRAGLSLGMVNLILNRLIETGYIRIKNLSGSRLSYLLTPKGIYEKTKTSYQYIQRTLSTYTKLRDVVSVFIEGLIDEGHTQFVVLGQSEISDLLCLAFSQYDQKKIEWKLCKNPGELDLIPNNGTVLLDCSYQEEYGHVGVSVIEKLLTIQTDLFFPSLLPSQTTP